MKIEDISNQLGFVGNLIIDWLDQLLHPFKSMTRIFEECDTDKALLQQSFKLWSVSFLMILIIQLPLYDFFGIDWQKIAFLLPSALLVLFSFIGMGVSIHLGLKIHKIPSKFMETYIIYVMIFSSHQPFVTLLAYPSMIDMFASIQTIKAEGMGFAETLIKTYTENIKISAGEKEGELSTYLTIIIGIISPFYAFGLFILIQRAISLHYQVDKYISLSAISLGASLGGILIFLFTLMGWFLCFIAL